MSTKRSLWVGVIRIKSNYIFKQPTTLPKLKIKPLTWHSLRRGSPKLSMIPMTSLKNSQMMDNFKKVKFQLIPMSIAHKKVLWEGLNFNAVEFKLRKSLPGCNGWRYLQPPGARSWLGFTWTRNWHTCCKTNSILRSTGKWLDRRWLNWLLNRYQWAWLQPFSYLTYLKYLAER